MNKKTKVNKFEEVYFQGYYKGAVGNFTAADLELSKRWFWSWLKKLSTIVPLEKGKGRSVLEIGCSIGAVANLLTERGFEVHASDISKYAVKNAKKLTPSATFFVHDIRKKITSKKKFDMVIAFEVVEHLEDPEKAIQNMVAVLKDGGYLILSSPYPYSWHYKDPTHINVKYPEEWLTLMKKAGIKKPTVHKFALIPFFYKFHKRLQIIIPFSVPIPYVNNPIFFIGKKT